MGWDVELRIPTGAGGYACVEVGSYTFNAAPMFTYALKCPLRDLDGKSAALASSILSEAVRRMQESPAEYEAIQPEDGWGNYSSALTFLETMLRTCRAHPNMVVSVR